MEIANEEDILTIDGVLGRPAPRKLVPNEPTQRGQPNRLIDRFLNALLLLRPNRAQPRRRRRHCASTRVIVQSESIQVAGPGSVDRIPRVDHVDRHARIVRRLSGSGKENRVSVGGRDWWVEFVVGKQIVELVEFPGFGDLVGEFAGGNGSNKSRIGGIRKGLVDYHSHQERLCVVDSAGKEWHVCIAVAGIGKECRRVRARENNVVGVEGHCKDSVVAMAANRVEPLSCQVLSIIVELCNKKANS